MQISQPLSSDAPARLGSGFYPSLRSDLGSTARNLSKVSRFYPIRSDFYLSVSDMTYDSLTNIVKNIS